MNRATQYWMIPFMFTLAFTACKSNRQTESSEVQAIKGATKVGFNTKCTDKASFCDELFSYTFKHLPSDGSKPAVPDVVANNNVLPEGTTNEAYASNMKNFLKKAIGDQIIWALGNLIVGYEVGMFANDQNITITNIAISEVSRSGMKSSLAGEGSALKNKAVSALAKINMLGINSKFEVNINIMNNKTKQVHTIFINDLPTNYSVQNGGASAHISLAEIIAAVTSVPQLASIFTDYLINLSADGVVNWSNAKISSENITNKKTYVFNRGTSNEQKLVLTKLAFTIASKFAVTICSDSIDANCKVNRDTEEKMEKTVFDTIKRMSIRACQMNGPDADASIYFWAPSILKVGDALRFFKSRDRGMSYNITEFGLTVESVVENAQRFCQVTTAETTFKEGELRYSCYRGKTSKPDSWAGLKSEYASCTDFDTASMILSPLTEGTIQ